MILFTTSVDDFVTSVALTAKYSKILTTIAEVNFSLELKSAGSSIPTLGPLLYFAQKSSPEVHKKGCFFKLMFLFMAPTIWDTDVIHECMPGGVLH